jgi:hypothetical protein
MASKQSLKIKAPDSGDILKMGLSTTTTLNSRFYRDKMFENPNKHSYHNYPAKVTAQKIGWILNDLQPSVCRDPRCDIEHLDPENNFGKEFLI